MPLQSFKRVLLQRDRDLFDTLRAAHWPTICEQMCTEAPTPQLSALLRTRWAVSGERMRTETANDELLARALRAWLPKYQGPDQVLFRGESVERYRAGKLGFCWSTQRETGEMFGSGLHAAFPDGGCLLQCTVHKAAILAEPNSHSRWMGEEEYVVDPKMLHGVIVVERYPDSR